MKRLDEKSEAEDLARRGGSSSGDVWQPRRGGPGPRAIASLVPAITQKSFEKHGFAAASLIMDWAQIVGRDRARDTRPLKLKWPRAVDKFSQNTENFEGRPGATLVIQVDPAVALDIQYQSAQLVERINTYFGYRAVANLKLVQEAIGPDMRSVEATSPGTASHTEQAAAVTRPAETKPMIGTVDPPDSTEKDPLSAALERLGAHVSAVPQRRRPDNCR